MGLESSFNYIDDLNTAWPTNTPDTVDEGDDHIRGIKSVLANQFPNLGSAIMSATAAELNAAATFIAALTKTAAELNNAPQIQLATNAVAVTTGTTVNLDLAIPSWVKHIKLTAHKLSTSGSFDVLIQLGNSAGFITTGYESFTRYDTNAQAGGADITGFAILNTAISTVNYCGQMEISKLDESTNIWQSNSQMMPLSTTQVQQQVGRVATLGTLDRIRITTTGGTFDGPDGLIGLMYIG